MVSLVLVGVAKLHYYDVYWDDYRYILVVFSFWGDPPCLRDILCQGKMLDTCHRFALIKMCLIGKLFAQCSIKFFDCKMLLLEIPSVFVNEMVKYSLF